MKVKPDADYAEFTVTGAGPFDWPALTIELKTTFNRDFSAALMKLPDGSRIFDGGSERKIWFIHPAQLEAAAAIASQFFKHVYLVERRDWTKEGGKVEGGEIITDLCTGAQTEQGSLF